MTLMDIPLPSPRRAGLLYLVAVRQQRLDLARGFMPRNIQLMFVRGRGFVMVTVFVT